MKKKTQEQEEKEESLRRREKAREEILHGPNRYVYAPHLDLLYKGEFLKKSHIHFAPHYYNFFQLMSLPMTNWTKAHFGYV